MIPFSIENYIVSTDQPFRFLTCPLALLNGSIYSALFQISDFMPKNYDKMKLKNEILPELHLLIVYEIAVVSA